MCQQLSNPNKDEILKKQKWFNKVFFMHKVPTTISAVFCTVLLCPVDIRLVTGSLGIFRTVAQNITAGSCAYNIFSYIHFQQFNTMINVMTGFRDCSLFMACGGGVWRNFIKSSHLLRSPALMFQNIFEAHPFLKTISPYTSYQTLFTFRASHPQPPPPSPAKCVFTVASQELHLQCLISATYSDHTLVILWFYIGKIRIETMHIILYT